MKRNEAEGNISKDKKNKLTMGGVLWREYGRFPYRHSFSDILRSEISFTIRETSACGIPFMHSRHGSRCPPIQKIG